MMRSPAVGSGCGGDGDALLTVLLELLLLLLTRGVDDDDDDEKLVEICL